MTAKQLKTDKGFDFSKKGKVSVWVSQYPYADIPDEYFEERFSRNNTRANNNWSDNFKLRFFNPESMETNGTHSGSIAIKKASGECSFSASYIDVLMSKAKKKKMTEVSWIILLFEYEYTTKLSGVEKDEYVTFLGAFNYDDEADSLFEVEDLEESPSE